MKWFTGVLTLEELHKRYIKLARQYHPDIGGNEEIMKEINAERDELQKSLKVHFKESTTWFSELEDLLRIARIKNYKIGWVAIQALKFARSYEDCLQIAKACHYKEGWAWYKWKEMENKSS